MQSSKVLIKYWIEDSDVYSFLTVLSIEYDETGANIRVKPKEKCFTVLCMMRLRGERGHAMVPSRPRATASNYSTPHTLLFTRVFYLCWYLYFVYISYSMPSIFFFLSTIFLSLFYIFISCIFISAFPLQDEEAGFCSRLLSKSQRAARVRLTLFPNANYFTFLIQRSSLLFIRCLRMSLGSIKSDESGLWQNVAFQVFG